MKVIKGITFDLEGTVIDLEKLHFDSFSLVAEECGVPISFETMHKHIPHLIGGGDAVVAEGLAVLMEHRLNPTQIRERKMFHYQNFLKEARIIPRQGFLSVFAQIQKMGLSVAIGSLTPKAQAEELLTRSGLMPLFIREHIILLEDVHNKKPAPDVYLKTAKRLGINPEAQLVFEDSVPGVKAARAAGSVVIAMPVWNFSENLAELNTAGALEIFTEWADGKLLTLLETITST